MILILTILMLIPMALIIVVLIALAVFRIVDNPLSLDQHAHAFVLRCARCIGAWCQCTPPRSSTNGCDALAKSRASERKCFKAPSRNDLSLPRSASAAA